MQRRINRNAPAKGEASAGVDTLLDIRESSHEPLSHGRPDFGSSIAQRANSFFFPLVFLALCSSSCQYNAILRALGHEQIKKIWHPA